jgi:Lar family restriction alleviation protein
MEEFQKIMRTAKLKRCPFCGSKVLLQRAAQGHHYVVQCMGNAEGDFIFWDNNGHGCGIQPCVMSDDKDSVIAAWNRRVPDKETK